MKPGSQWVFRETDAEGTVSRVVVTVLDKTKLIANGVEADRPRPGDRRGPGRRGHLRLVCPGRGRESWYLGDTTEYENGKPKTKEGSWEAGVDGALPGIIMPADPWSG